MWGRRFLILAGLMSLSMPALGQGATTAPTFTDITYGSEKAPITVVEYASLSCPHCAHFHSDILPKLKARFIDNGQVRLVVKDIPNNAPGLRAAQLARCLGDDKHARLADVLFKTQAQWLNNDFMNGLARIGALAGVGPAQFQACMANRQVEDFMIRRQQEAGQRWQVMGTPTFIINDGAARVEEASEAKLFAALEKLGAKPAP
ncbi:MAG: DsbA family protein [Niveispirillum sp.]|uniref:DsbA family protein n=1 Tax=Niveispirillum sp. TaxID=1917217 RepID=UPI004035B8BE